MCRLIRGGALIEGVFLVPVLMMLVMGASQLSSLFEVRTTANTVLSEALRQAATTPGLYNSEEGIATFSQRILMKVSSTATNRGIALDNFLLEYDQPAGKITISFVARKTAGCLTTNCQMEQTSMSGVGPYLYGTTSWNPAERQYTGGGSGCSEEACSGEDGSAGPGAGAS